MSSINKNQKLSERKVFRINVGTITPGKAEFFLKEIISKFKKTPLIDYRGNYRGNYRDNIYVKKLLIEKFQSIHTESVFTAGGVFYPEGKAVIEDYFIPTR